MARRRDDEEEYEYEEEYEEEYEGNSWFDSISNASWRRGIVIPLILILFAFGTWFIWKKYRDEVHNHPSYLLDIKSIKYTAPPEWLKRDILGEVFKLGSLESKRIHEPGLTVHVRNAFVHHPWVKEVERIRPHYPATLEAVVVYRTPVAFVALPDDDPNDGKYWMLPVDAESTLLPAEDFTAEFARGFPRIDVGNTVPLGPVGSAWGDEIVADAAKIAELLFRDWDSLRDVVYQIERSSQPTSTSSSADFDIRGRPAPDGRSLVIHWGRAPGKEQAGEPSSKAKLAKLKEWANDTKLTGRTSFEEIDLRSIRALQATRATSRFIR